MRPDERRALEKLFNDKWRKYRDAQIARGEREGKAVAMAIDWCMGDLRSTLDHLTDEQSEPGHAAPAEAAFGDAVRHTTKAMERLHRSPEPPDSTEPEDDVDPWRNFEIGDRCMADGTAYIITHIDRSDPKHPTVRLTPADELDKREQKAVDELTVERVAKWLHEKRVTCLAGTSAPEPAISTYRNTARRLLHDTGILTKESETP